MPLESATFVQDLVASNPVGATDPKSDGDNHIRLIKQALKNTFPDANEAIPFSTFIKTLLDDVDAATARATLGAAAAASAYVDPLTTRGDILFRNPANVTARLPIGAAARLLRSDGTDVSWAQVNLPTDVTGILPAASTPDFDPLALVNNPPNTAYVVGTTGAGLNKKFQLPEIGGWCALTEQIAAASATLDFVLTPYLTDFEDFEFIISNLVPTTDNQDLWMRFSTDGGGSFDAAVGNYSYITQNCNTATASFASSASDTKVVLNGADGLGNAAGEKYNARIMIYAPAQVKRTQYDIRGSMSTQAAGIINSLYGAGQRLAEQDTDAVRFLMSAGTLASGKIVLMGRRKVT